MIYSSFRSLFFRDMEMKVTKVADTTRYQVYGAQNAAIRVTPWKIWVASTTPTRLSTKFKSVISTIFFVTAVIILSSFFLFDLYFRFFSFTYYYDKPNRRDKRK